MLSSLFSVLSSLSRAAGGISSVVRFWDRREERGERREERGERREEGGERREERGERREERGERREERVLMIVNEAVLVEVLYCSIVPKN